MASIEITDLSARVIAPGAAMLERAAGLGIGNSFVYR